MDVDPDLAALFEELAATDEEGLQPAQRLAAALGGDYPLVLRRSLRSHVPLWGPESDPWTTSLRRSRSWPEVRGLASNAGARGSPDRPRICRGACGGGCRPSRPASCGRGALVSAKMKVAWCEG